MPTTFETLNDAELRTYVSAKITENMERGEYTFPASFPVLHRYTKFSDYSVNDIISGTLTLTRIGEFNDVYDGIVHTASKANDIGNNRNMLDYLGFHVCCLSEDKISTLMWSHYSENNTGICVSYDFNELPDDHVFKPLIFPIAYLKKPICIPDLFKADDACKYPVDANALITVLCKYNVWEYEKEWRIFFISPQLDPDKEQLSLKYDNSGKNRLHLNLKLKPREVSFGCWFMKNFVYDENTDDGKKAAENIDKAKELLEYMKNNSIECSIIKPQFGEYQLKSYKVSPKSMLDFMNAEFSSTSPNYTRFRYVIQEHFISFLQKEAATQA